MVKHQPNSILPENTETKPKDFFLWICLGVLLIVAVSLISHADELSIWADETWSIFHSTKTVSQILFEPDLTWPFGYYLLLHTWSGLATWNDFALHMFGVYCGLLAAAFLIRAGKLLLSPSAGVLAALAFGTSSYALYFLLEIRGYGLMLLTEAAFVFFYLRWRQKATPRRSIGLLVAQIAMLYTQFMLGVVIVLAALHLLVTAPRRFIHWLGLAAFTWMAFIPLLPQFLRGFTIRSTVGSSGPLPSYFLYGLDSIYRAYSSYWDVWFAIILLLMMTGLISALWRLRRLRWQTFAWLFVWAVAIPVAAYLVRERFTVFTTRYLSFTLPAAFLLIGVGLAALPYRWIGAAALLILALAPWHPFDHRPRYSDGVPTRDFMRAMAQDYQPGDWLVIDPVLRDQVNSLEWWYYKSLYFPNGDFRLANDGIQAGRRVWNLVRQGSEDQAVLESVQKGRVIVSFWGPWYFIATLYEAPPLDQRVHFGDNLAFYGADVQRAPAIHAGDTLDVTLWWSTDRLLPLDYSISLQMLDPHGKLIAQVDGAPKTPGTPEQLSAWKPGVLYLDRRRIEVPHHLQDGYYTLNLVVYQSWDGVRLMPERNATPDRAMVIDNIHLLSYAVW